MFISPASTRLRLTRVAARSFLILPLFLTTASATVATSVSCFVSSGLFITDTTSCSLDSGGAQAFGLGGYSIAANLLTTIMSGSAIAGQFPYGASMDGSIGINLYTAGPLRPGFVEVIAGYSSFPISPSGNSYGVEQWSLSSTNLFHICDVQSCFEGPAVEPILLGSAFQFGQMMQLQANGDDMGGAAVGADDAVVLQFWEADGVTPVALFEVPEPGSWWLLLLGLAGVLMAYKGRKGRMAARQRKELAAE